MEIFKKILIANPEVKKQKVSLKLKTALLLSISSFIFFFGFIFIVYIIGSHELRDINIENHREMARLIASSVDAIVAQQAELLKIEANSQFVIDAVKDNNLKYKSMNEGDVKRYLMDMDKRWIEAPREHPFLKEYLENKLSDGLKSIKRQEVKMPSIVVTDKYGGLIGATNRPSGFFSFNQDWWQAAYANGEGKTYAGNIEYDEAANAWYLPFVIPIKDESGAVIGIYKAGVGIDTFFAPLYNFKVGRTGKAVLVDDKAYLIYQYKTEPFTNKFCEYNELKAVLQNENKWGLLDSAYSYPGKTLVAYSEVDHPLLVARGLNWLVFVEQDLKEIFMPLNKLIFQMVLVAMVLIVILWLLIFILIGENSPGFSLLQIIKDSSSKKQTEKQTEKKESNIKNKSTTAMHSATVEEIQRRLTPMIKKVMDPED